MLQPFPDLFAPRLVGPPPGHGREGIVCRQRRGPPWSARPPLERRLDRRPDTRRLRPHLGLVALLERGEYLATEQLERLADVLVSVPAGLQHEDDLIDSGLLEPLQVVTYLLRGTRCATQTGALARGQLGPEALLAKRCLDLGRVALITAPLEIFGPHVGRARSVLSEDVVVPQRIAEEVPALQAAVECHLLVGV